MKDEAQRKQRLALEGGALTPALKGKFESLPDTIEELDVEMQRAQSKVKKRREDRGEGVINAILFFLLLLLW